MARMAGQEGGRNWGQLGQAQHIRKSADRRAQDWSVWPCVEVVGWVDLGV